MQNSYLFFYRSVHVRSTLIVVIRVRIFDMTTRNYARFNRFRWVHITAVIGTRTLTLILIRRFYVEKIIVDGRV